MGEAEQARQWMDRALAIDPDDSHIRYNAACMWAQLGDSERALDLLEQWAKHMGLENKNWMQQDPDLDSLRDHPRYARIVELIDSAIAERQH